MAVAVRSTATAISGSGSVVVTKPAGTVSGDVMIAQICNTTANTAPSGGGVPTGWALLDGVADAGVGWWTGTYWKLAGGSEPANYTWTVAGTIDGGITTLSGADGTTPVDKHVGTSLGTQTAPASAAVVNGSASDIVLYFLANDNSNSMTKPTGTTQPYNTDCISMAWKTQAGSGTTGTGVWAVASSPCIVHTVTIQPPLASDPYPLGYLPEQAPTATTLRM